MNYKLVMVFMQLSHKHIKFDSPLFLFYKILAITTDKKIAVIYQFWTTLILNTCQDKQLSNETAEPIQKLQ